MIVLSVEGFQSIFYITACCCFAFISYIYAKIYCLALRESRLFKNNFNRMCAQCKSEAIL